MKATALKGLGVRSANSSETLETVEDLILDVDERHILALQLTQGDSELQFVLPVSDVQSVDDQEIVVQSGAAPIPLPDQGSYLNKPTLNKMIGESAITEDGQSLGKVADLDIDTVTWQVQQYDIMVNVADAFKNGLQQIPVGSAMTGERTLIVTRGGNAAG